MAITSNFSDYAASGAGTGAENGTGQDQDSPSYWSLERLKRSYMDYLNSKSEEIEEQKEARRYHHSSQWSQNEISVLKKRKQPIVTYNRIKPKINGVVGLIEKLRQAPKAYPRTPKEQGAADLSTAVIRYVLDEQNFKSKSPLVGEAAAVDGFGGVELILETGDHGDPEIAFELVENDGFFYDPRSIRLDFSDARYMGQGKWLDLDQAKEMFPDEADELQDAAESAGDLSSNSDRENKWFITDGYTKRIRVVDAWYIMDKEWCWCVFTGDKKLMEGKSWLHDEKGKTFPKYVMFSSNVDQDGDRYGFVRQFKSAQDEINQRRSKALHLANSRRIIAEKGAFPDLEQARREAVRPDGVIEIVKNFKVEFDDVSKQMDLKANLEFLQEAKMELDSYGPTLSLIGQEPTKELSGRAIALQQQAGVAQLGPFMVAYRGWKIRLYRAIWNAVREHWKQERWIRVTDDDNVLNFLGINQVSVDPMTGMPQMQNQLSNLDVDIILDEGPDSINMMADTFEALTALAQSGAQVPPDVLLELAPGIDSNTKKRLIERLQQPDPAQQAAQQAEIAKVQAEGQLLQAKAVDTMRPQQEKQDHPAKIAADIEKTHADTALKKAQAMATMQQAMLEPQKVAHDQSMDMHSADQADRQTAIKAHDSVAKAQQGRESNQIAREGHQVTRDTASMKAEAGDERPKKKKKSGVSISLDGSLASQINESAKANANSMSSIGQALVEAARQNADSLSQATNILAQAGQSMAESSRQIADAVGGMTKAISAPKRLVRDSKGRASHTETIGM